MKSVIITAESTAPGDSNGVTITIRPGAYSPDAAVFARELYEMYWGYSSLQGWTVDIISYVPDGEAGIKEAVILVEGAGVYEQLKYETGVHRVQRAPADERWGRIHTSVARVSVQPTTQGRPVTLPTESPSEKIRTYNVPDNRVTDHRIRFTVAGVREVLDGNLAPFIDKLRTDC